MARIIYSDSKMGRRMVGTPNYQCESCKKRFQTKAIALKHECAMEAKNG